MGTMGIGATCEINPSVSLHIRITSQRMIMIPSIMERRGRKTAHKDYPLSCLGEGMVYMSMYANLSAIFICCVRPPRGAESRPEGGLYAPAYMRQSRVDE